MNWIKVQGSAYPQEIDTDSSKVYNYVTRNVTEVEKEDEMTGETVTLYEYELLKIHKEEWGLYLQTEQNTAYIDFIAMMSDIDLPEEG